MNAFSRAAHEFRGSEDHLKHRSHARRPGRILVATKAGAHRATLSKFLFNRGQACVVAETAQEVLFHLKAGGFDLVVSALRDADGFELTRLVRRVAPGLPVVVVALGESDLDAAHLDFATGLKREVFGETVSARLSGLTARERQVLGLVVAGRTNKIIAYELSISPRTVENHRGRIMEKLNVKSVAELVRLSLAAENATPGTLEIAASRDAARHLPAAAAL